MTSNTSLPSRLYKYQPYSAQTLTNLSRRVLWFAAPSDFNDPFDCAVASPDESFDIEGTKTLLRRYLDEGHEQARAVLDALESDPQQAAEMTEGFKRTFRNALAQGVKEHISIRGVACLSATATDILMWSHYAQGHRGFCLEFSTEYAPFSSAKPVTYRREAQPIDALRLITRDFPPGELVDGLMLTKFETWSYEKEWRILHKSANSAYHYAEGALTGVFFGAAMPQDHMEVVARLLQGSSTPMYAMARAKTGFAVSAQLLKNQGTPKAAV